MKTIKDILEEFENRANHENYTKGKYSKIVDPTEKCLLDTDRYPESPYELSEEKISDFISSSLTTLLNEFCEEMEKKKIDPVWLAEAFHDYYEATARLKGWNTQENCRGGFDTLPPANKETMLCTASKVALELEGRSILQVEEIKKKMMG